jgi:hypothetical protein
MNDAAPPSSLLAPGQIGRDGCGKWHASRAFHRKNSDDSRRVEPIGKMKSSG